TPNNTRQKISGRETHVFISANGDHVSLKPSPHHRFTKQRRITKPTVYRNPPYHTGKTPKPRTSTTTGNYHESDPDHRRKPPTTVLEDLGNQTATAYAESVNRSKSRAHPNDFINQPQDLRFCNHKLNRD
ncbi:hypothetical protein HID58_039458, partial [Brassica napus]